jgi:hypothetical protein
MLSKLATVTLVAVFSLSGPYQQNDAATLRREIEALKAQQAAMQQDLETIKMILLKMMPKPAEEALVNMTVPVAGEPARGAATAKVMLVEVSDYHCPYCRRHTQMTQPQIDATYINNGKVRPCSSTIRSSSCLRRSRRTKPQTARPSKALGHAREARRPPRATSVSSSRRPRPSEWTQAVPELSEGAKYDPVRESVARMPAVDSTPTFLVGLTPPTGQPMKILKVVGCATFEQFKVAIDPLLNRRATRPQVADETYENELTLKLDSDLREARVLAPSTERLWSQSRRL